MKAITKNTIIILLLLFFSGQLHAQKKNINHLVDIEIVPNHADWTYKISEEAIFTVQVLRAHTPLDGIELSYEIGPEKMNPTRHGKVETKGGKTILKGGTMREPGFMTYLQSESRGA